MKKIIAAIASIYLLSGCFVFQKQEKYGCPANGSIIGAEKIAAGDAEAIKKNEKTKYKGGRKSYEYE